MSTAAKTRAFVFRAWIGHGTIFTFVAQLADAFALAAFVLSNNRARSVIHAGTVIRANLDFASCSAPAWVAHARINDASAVRTAIMAGAAAAGGNGAILAGKPWFALAHRGFPSGCVFDFCS